MSDQLPVVLTSKDFALLEAISQGHGEPFAGATEIIRRKLGAATLVFPSDVPANVVTLNSRVRFRAGDAQPEERTLIGELGEEVHGLTLSLGTPRGLALIGAAVGQTIAVQRKDGRTEQLHIEAVTFQPALQRSRPALKIVSSQQMEPPATPASHTSARPFHRGFDDDPGPSAA